MVTKEKVWAIWFICLIFTLPLITYGQTKPFEGYVLVLPSTNTFSVTDFPQINKAGRLGLAQSSGFNDVTAGIYKEVPSMTPDWKPTTNPIVKFEDPDRDEIWMKADNWLLENKTPPQQPSQELRPLQNPDPKKPSGGQPPTQKSNQQKPLDPTKQSKESCVVVTPGQSTLYGNMFGQEFVVDDTGFDAKGRTFPEIVPLPESDINRWLRQQGLGYLTPNDWDVAFSGGDRSAAIAIYNKNSNSEKMGLTKGRGVLPNEPQAQAYKLNKSGYPVRNGVRMAPRGDETGNGYRIGEVVETADKGKYAKVNEDCSFEPASEADFKQFQQASQLLAQGPLESVGMGGGAGAGGGGGGGGIAGLLQQIPQMLQQFLQGGQQGQQPQQSQQAQQSQLAQTQTPAQQKEQAQKLLLQAVAQSGIPTEYLEPVASKIGPAVEYLFNLWKNDGAQITPVS